MGYLVHGFELGGQGELNGRDRVHAQRKDYRPLPRVVAERHASHHMLPDADDDQEGDPPGRERPCEQGHWVNQA